MIFSNLSSLSISTKRVCLFSNPPHYYYIITFSNQIAISLLEGKSFNKPDYSPLYIENPMEKDLNVCKNVSGVEFKKLLLHGYNSIDAMHCRDFHLIDLLDPEYFKLLEKNSKPNQKRN